MDYVDAGRFSKDEHQSACDIGTKCSKKRRHEENGGQVSEKTSKMATSSKVVTYTPTSSHYDMTGDKLMFIFNHAKYRKTKYYATAPVDREGTGRDVSRLQHSFGNIGFKIEQFDDYTYQEIDGKLTDICDNMDHGSTSCLVIVLLTHGCSSDLVYAADKTYPLDDVITPVLKASKLVGKPKLFFIQACRGSSADCGVPIWIDVGQAKYTIPSFSDAFVLRSTYDDHISFRTKNGSWMIQAFCDVVDQRVSQNILDVAIRTNNLVAQKNSSHEKNGYDEKKQILVVWFTLTKILNLYDENVK